AKLSSMMGSAAGVWFLLALGVFAIAIVLWSHRRQGRRWREAENRWRLEQKSLGEDVRRRREALGRLQDAIGLLHDLPPGRALPDILLDAFHAGTGCQQLFLFAAQPFSTELRLIAVRGAPPETLP